MSDSVKTAVVVPPQTPEEKKEEKADIRKWRVVLVLGALVFLLLTIGFQVWSSMQTSQSTVTTTGTDATTKNGKVVTDEKKGPPDTLVATTAGAAAALLAAAAFYGRIKKFSFGGADLEFTTPGELTAPEEKAVVEKTVAKADSEGLPAADKTAAVATALDTARGAKAMIRSGVTPDSPEPDLEISSLELLLDPDRLADYSATTAVNKFK